MLPADLPISDALKSAAIPLGHLGVRDIASPRTQALEIVSALAGTPWAILGGDVFVVRQGAFAYALANWHSDRHADESCSDFVQRSHDETRRYIERYPEKNDTVSYGLVFALCI